MAFSYWQPCSLLSSSRWSSGQCPTPFSWLNIGQGGRVAEGVPAKVSCGDLVGGYCQGCKAIEHHMFPCFRAPQLLLLSGVYTAVSVSARVLNSAHVVFMSDCPHVCVCMHNAASQSDGHFSKGFKESIQAVERQRTHPGKRQFFEMEMGSWLKRGKTASPPILHRSDYTPLSCSWTL